MTKLRTQIGLHHTKQTCACSLQLSVVHSKNAAHSRINRCALPWGSRCLASWENLAFHSHHWLGPHSPSILHQSISSDFCGPHASHRKLESDVHHSLCCISHSECFWCCWVGRKYTASSWHSWPLRRLQKKGLESVCFIFLLKTGSHCVALTCLELTM